MPVRRQEARGLLAAERREARQQVADQQVAGRLAAHVQLVALVQALRRELEDLDRADPVDEAAHERAEVVAEEAQALDRLVGVGAEPQRLAGALVERREGARAGALVLDDPHRHRRRADAGHRADVVVLVAGGEADDALLDHRAGAVAVVAPSPRTGRPRRARGAAGRRAGAARSAGRSGSACGPRPAPAGRRAPWRCRRRAAWHASIRSTTCSLASRDRRAVGAPQALERARRPRDRRTPAGASRRRRPACPGRGSRRRTPASPTLTTSTLLQHRLIKRHVQPPIPIVH